MPALETMLFYSFGFVLATSIAGFVAISYYADRARRRQKHAETLLEKQETLLRQIRGDFQKLRLLLRQRVGVQQAEARVSKAISEMLSSVEEFDEISAKKPVRN